VGRRRKLERVGGPLDCPVIQLSLLKMTGKKLTRTVHAYFESSKENNNGERIHISMKEQKGAEQRRSSDHFFSSLLRRKTDN